MTRILLCVAGAVAIASCDPNAKANDRTSITTDRLSQAYESCARSSDCADDLRCFDHVCVSTEASVVGDYRAAVGAAALAAGSIDRAIKAYTDAVNRYESDKIPAPLAVLCGKGRALAGALNDRERAEKAARTLHECLLRAPVGSTMRQRALADLARLGAVGLNPELLARDSVVTEYLTLQPAGPSSSKIQLTATGDAKTRSRAYTEFLDALQGDGMRGQLLPCWEAHYKATKEKNLVTTIGFRYRFYEGYDESEDRDKLTPKGPEPAAGTGQKCVYDIVVPMADEFSKDKKGAGRWDGTITITLQ